jgi:hypothetical protein
MQTGFEDGLIEMADKPETITWIVGAPRSGTHLINSLLYTGEG